MHRLSLVWMAAAALSLGCGDKAEGPAGGPDTGAGSDGGDGDDGDDGSTEETVYPSGRRVLLDYSHNGYGPESSGKAEFTAIDAHWSATYGWNTDHRGSFTSDLSDHRVVGFLAPGINGAEDFSQEEIDALTAALAAGTRVIVFGDRTGCGVPGITTFLAALGSTMSFTGESAGENSLALTDDFDTSHQIGAGLTEPIKMKEPCYVNPTGGQTVVRDNNRNVLVASQQIGSGGDVVLVGDFQFMDDGSNYLASGDTQRFADNLVIVDPNWAPDDSGDDSGAAR